MDTCSQPQLLFLVPPHTVHPQAFSLLNSLCFHRNQGRVEVGEGPPPRKGTSFGAVWERLAVPGELLPLLLPPPPSPDPSLNSMFLRLCFYYIYAALNLSSIVIRFSRERSAHRGASLHIHEPIHSCHPRGCQVPGPMGSSLDPWIMPAARATQGPGSRSPARARQVA